MRAPDFWNFPRVSALAHILSPVGAVYGAVTALGMRRAPPPAGIPVICIGNFTAGGAGKTPAALAVARMLTGMGERPFFLSRGYGGRFSKSSQPVLVDPDRHGEADAGDEPLLLARLAPGIVAADRHAGARAAEAAGANVLVLDDGLQSAGLAHDFAFAVIDGAVGAGNGLCIPAGPLRAPLAAQWPHTDAVIVIGGGEAGARLAIEARNFGKPVLRGRLVADPACAATLRQRRALAFAGIGRPEKFFATLRETGAQVAATRVFADHHAYSAADMSALRAEAQKAHLTLVTTEKDFVRLPADSAADVTALPVTLEFENAGALAALLKGALARRR